MSILNSSIWHVNCCREPSPAGLPRPASHVPESSDQRTESASHNHQRFSRQGWGLAQSPCTGPIGATLLDRDNIKGSRAVLFPPRMGDRLLRGFVELATELQKPLYFGIEMHSRGASKGSRARIAKRNFGTVESNRASSVERTPSGAPLHFEDVKANAGRKISALLDPRLAARIDCKIARIAKPGKKPCKRDPRARDWRAGVWLNAAPSLNRVT